MALMHRAQVAGSARLVRIRVVVAPQCLSQARYLDSCLGGHASANDLSTTPPSPAEAESLVLGRSEDGPGRSIAAHQFRCIAMWPSVIMTIFHPRSTLEAKHGQHSRDGELLQRDEQSMVVT